jgi:hypothetical protein
MGRGFQFIYHPKATDLSCAEFARAEKERLGVTADDRLVVWRIVSPPTADAHNRGGR